ncbi:hypothetical protein GCM10008024_40060 [Allgaiera indica]|uniref:Uncharacterized protein n=1 Tax=Allgaiera indica TaxID=765699 RepID=A0AAN4UV31_9RHOB|nr:hypothetical protein GCM10008024_40060 [Allgaiera indica]
MATRCDGRLKAFLSAVALAAIVAPRLCVQSPITAQEKRERATPPSLPGVICAGAMIVHMTG